MERMIGAILAFSAENLKCLLYWRSGEGEEGLVVVMALSKDFFQEFIGFVDVINVNSVLFRVFFPLGIEIGQRFAEGTRGFTTLALVSLIDNDGELTTIYAIEVFVCKEELLNGADDDLALVVNGFD